MAISHKLWVVDLSVWWTWLTDWVLGFSWKRGWCGDGCESTNSPGLWEAAKNSSILASLTLVSDSTCERELPKSGLNYIWFGLQTVEAGAEWKSENVPSNFEGSMLEMVSYFKFRAPSVSFPYFSKQSDKRSLQLGTIAPSLGSDAHWLQWLLLSWLLSYHWSILCEQLFYTRSLWALRARLLVGGPLGRLLALRAC